MINYKWYGKNSFAIFYITLAPVGARNLRSQPTLYSGPKAQAEEPYCQGRMMKAPQRPKNVAEDDLTLNTSQNAWRKGQTQYKSSTREKAANTVMWSPVFDKPILPDHAI